MLQQVRLNFFAVKHDNQLHNESLFFEDI